MAGILHARAKLAINPTIPAKEMALLRSSRVANSPMSRFPKGLNPMKQKV